MFYKKKKKPPYCQAFMTMLRENACNILKVIKYIVVMI